MNMKPALLVLLLLAAEALSQSDAYIINQQGSFTLMPLYQRWSLKDGSHLSESSAAFSLYYPLGREWSASLRGAPAGVDGGPATLNGFADAQIAFTYHIERPDIVFTLGVNLPTGKKELTQEEFQTSMLLSNSILNFQTPNFGQGLNVNPGFIWAIPLSEDFVFGLGATYQYKGKFKPLKNYDDYDPGDEILVTGGMDVHIGEGATFSADIVYTMYGTDKLGRDDVYASGGNLVANVQFSKSIASNDLLVSARFRTKGKSDVAIGGVMVPEADRIEPDQLGLLSQYTVLFTEHVSVGFVGEVKFYQESPTVISGITLFGLGVSPVISLSSSVALPFRIKYQFGNFNSGGTLSGVEGGVGLRLNLP